MPWLGFEATDPRGERVEDRILVRDVQEGIRVLGQRGYSGIEIYTLPRGASDEHRGPTPQATWPVVLVGIAFFSLVVWFLLFFQEIVSLPLLFVAIAAHSAVFLWFGWSHGIVAKYRALLDAYTWGRDEEVIRSAAEISPRLQGTRMQLDVDFRAAGALWALGRDAEAEALVERHRKRGKGTAHWWARRGESLSHARRDREAVEALREAIAAEGAKPAFRIALAMALLEIDRVIDEPRQLIAEAEKCRLSWTESALAALARGALALEEARHGDAVRELGDARRRMRWWPLGKERPGWDAMIDSYLCMARAALGSPDAAVCLSRARGLLTARGDHSMLARCEHALLDRGLPYR